MRRSRRFTALAVAGAAALMFTGLSPSASAEPGTDTSGLREAVTLDAVRGHQAAFQAIADANGGTRAAGTPGYDASADYVAGELAAAGYDVERQPFVYEQFIENAPSQLEQLAPIPEVYTWLSDFFTMSYSGSGVATGPVESVDLDLPPLGGSDSGCEPDDFADFTAGNIALMQRGTCNFSVKVDNAVAAGAAGAIIFNEGNSPDREALFGGNLGAPQSSIPALSASFAFGEELAAQEGAILRMEVDAVVTTTETENVLATSTSGRSTRQVVVGAHLDSVPEGPGIQDNGSGSAAILEVAIQMAETGVTPKNQVRFAFWGGEEDGLLGSTYYVSQLSPTELKNTEVNLNFDMVGSPNFVRFVYDGDGSSFGLVGPAGSDNVEAVFNDYFGSQGLATEATAFDGRSDYFAFINNGIPAGGLFTGAEGIKTPEQAAIYGGTAGEAYDPCYHLACDTFDNVSLQVLDEMSDAIAHSTLVFAQQPGLTKTPAAVNNATKALSNEVNA